ncbi:hypothetical protein Lesp02_33830 [Lentzea sp. NBRC 105346]|nr:hypothetical protein Lesp02_33830 [Lentzea sp. NBRC 105346]
MLLAVAVSPLAVACTTPPPPPPPDPLVELAAAARNDAALASLATGIPAAAEVAKNRTEHAERLQAEIDRERPPSTVSSTPTPAPTTPPTPPDPVAALRAALDDSQRKAAALVPTLPTHRAGLVGSISAGCASLLEVLA